MPFGSDPLTAWKALLSFSPQETVAKRRNKRVPKFIPSVTPAPLSVTLLSKILITTLLLRRFRPQVDPPQSVHHFS